jgi:hypothetical protein
MIDPGQKWKAAIQENLRYAKAAVLLVSRYFFASDFIANHELPPILNTAAQNGLKVLWVAVSASPYEDSALSAFQAANDPSRPLDSLSQADLGRSLVTIAGKIRQALRA